MIPVVVGAGSVGNRTIFGIISLFGPGAPGRVTITWPGGSGASSSAGPTAQCPATLTIGAQCPAGQYWNGTLCLPIPNCPAGQIWNGTQCVSQCPAGQAWNGTQCVNQCPAGQYWNGSACAAIPVCTGGRVWNGSACVCLAGQQWEGGQCVAQCGAGQHRGVLNQCLCSDDIAPIAGSCGVAIQSFTVKPALVRKGDTTKVSWSVVHALSCSVNGTNGDVWSALSRIDQVSGPIIAQTIYTLSCLDLGGLSAAPQKKTVNLVPVFQER